MTHSLIGLDLAWVCERNGSGLAIGSLQGSCLTLEAVHTDVLGQDRIVEIIESVQNLAGVAVDAPLIIRNASGSRPCEKSLGKVYSARWAGCHPSNLELLPEASSVRLSNYLSSSGFRHLGNPDREKWQLECYPHPAIIELFGLERRLAYKKGRVDQKKAGQLQLAKYIRSLADRSDLVLVIGPESEHVFDPVRISSLSGQALKGNEDALDAVICLYVAALYAVKATTRCFGDVENGYIVVPG